MIKFQIIPMTAALAAEILHWKYEGDYAIYNYDRSADYILSPANWGACLFAVLDEAGRLVGELSMGFLDEATDEWVEQEAVETGRLSGSILWIGFGLRPDLTGQGMGLDFVRACTDFAVQQAIECYRYPGEYVGLGVARFNQRAITVYERAGFEKFQEGTGTISGQMFETQRMKKKLYKVNR